MNEATAKTTEPKINAATETKAPVVRPMPTVNEALANIRIDCRDEPQRYLDEVDVPGGGE